MNKFNYDLIQEFNEIIYSKLLFPKHMVGNEVFVNNAKNNYGEDVDVKEYFYPFSQ